jgi:orotidine-5'-phosphate decarboxylase
MVSDPRLIVSLDYAETQQALALAARLDPRRCRVKVGKELFTRSGPAVVEKLVQSGFSVFLDLKFHDIPNTVAGACAAAAGLGVWMVNIHAAGGARMIAAARDSIDKSGHRPLLVTVTVLTSMSAPDLHEVGVAGTVEEQVLNLARLSRDHGADGVVCSAMETRKLRKHMPPGFCLVTPGIRPAGSDRNDQERIVTPFDAVTSGSDYLVIGRPVTQAADPLRALEEIEKEVIEALHKNKTSR